MMRWSATIPCSAVAAAPQRGEVVSFWLAFWLHFRLNTGMEIALSMALGLGIPAVLTWAYHTTLDIAPLWIWLITLNLTLLGLMGKDKLAATKRWRRTPEVTLLLLTFLGGTPAMLLGRKMFRHKTVKQEFLYALWGTLAAQLGCVIYFWRTLLAWL